MIHHLISDNQHTFNITDQLGTGFLMILDDQVKNVGGTAKLCQRYTMYIGTAFVVEDLARQKFNNVLATFN